MRHLIVLALAVAVAAGSSACDEEPGGGGGQQTPPPAGGATTPGSTGARTQAPPAQPGGAIASREVRVGGITVRVDITVLRRQGQTLTLNWRLTVVEAESGWFPWDTMGSAAGDITVSGVTMVDPANAQRYLVARSGGPDGPCACTQNINFGMDEGDASEFFATYSAPPADITAINVEFPRFGAFNDVAIS